MKGKMALSERMIWIWGAGGHARSVFEVIIASGWRLAGAIDPYFKGEAFCGAPVHPEMPAAEAAKPFAAALALGDNMMRRRILGEIAAACPGAHFPVLAHPSASVAHDARIGRGTIVFQKAAVGCGADIGEGCVVNSSSSIDHECVIGAFSSIAPGATLGGRVRMGENAFVGMGAVVLQGRKIADGVVVGAASLVNRDLTEPGGYWGVPARLMKPPEKMAGFLSR